MDFSFKTRGGTAPVLTRVYGRSNRTGRSAQGEARRQRDRMEDVDGVSGLPWASPAFCCQRLDKGPGKTSKPQAGWQKRHAKARRNNDSVGSMPSTRPPSRQALSDLMDLNLIQKYDKIWNHGFSSRKQQRERRHAFAASATTKKNNEGLGAAAYPPSDPGRGHDRQAGYSRDKLGYSDGDKLDEDENGDVKREQGNRWPCQEASTQQSERDQLMWSALKTPIMSDGEIKTDTHCHGLELFIARREIGASTLKHNDYIGVKTVEEPPCTLVKGTRNMEQLDLERSNMDRTLRPHRVVSARLLESREESSPSNKVKYARNLSASASRPHTRQSESISSVWAGAGGILQRTSVRGELILRNGESGSGLSDDVNASEIDGIYDIAANAGSERQRRVNDYRQACDVDLGRFQWMTNEEDPANVLQRPPSRQKEAFPKHLADVIPYPAFQVEVPVTGEQAKQHIEATRKNAVEQARPPSRHKPPEQSLFLEPTATTRDPRGTIFALDRRHDNPDRDGFSVLQVQGPCPFRIEVTNSFVQPHPPKVPVGREVVFSSNRDTTSKKNGTAGHGIQRAPNNTPINMVASSFGHNKMQTLDDAAEKGTCATPFSTIGSRSAGGLALRGPSHPVSDGINCGDATLALDFRSPLTHPGGVGVERGFDIKGESGTTEGGSTCRLGEENVESKIWKPGDHEQVSEVAGLADTSSLRANTGTPELHGVEWYIESCDDADGGAVLDPPAVSTLGESAGAKHTLLNTTLGQDFLSLFAPSLGRDDSTFINAFDAF